MRTLAQALEDYGVAAQSYFKGEDGKLRDEVAAVDEEDLAPWRGFAEGDMPEGVKGVFLSVVFEADNSLRIYFTYSEGHDPGDYSYATDGSPAQILRRGDGALLLIDPFDLKDSLSQRVKHGHDTPIVIFHGKIGFEIRPQHIRQIAGLQRFFNTQARLQPVIVVVDGQKQQNTRISALPKGIIDFAKISKPAAILSRLINSGIQDDI